MKTAYKLDLNTEEKKYLRTHKLSVVQLQDYAFDEIEALLQVSSGRAAEIAGLIEFQSIPSLGFGFAKELTDQGYTSLAQLAGKRCHRPVSRLRKALPGMGRPLCRRFLPFIGPLHYPPRQK